jgi:hypothetical protein
MYMDEALKVLIIKAGMTYGPELVRAVIDLLAKKDPVAADFEPFLTILEKNYASYIETASKKAGGV